jgi:type II secretory pathway pseudopilin PulG
MPPGSARGRQPRRLVARQEGFTYFGILILVVFMGLMLAAAGEVASTQARREREVELLFIGHQYREAIALYFRANHRWPTELKDLVEDNSGAAISQHFLRRLYPDPMTRAADWTLLPAPNGGYMGIASRSTLAPLKRAGFDPDDVDFDKAEHYADWVFTSEPARAARRVPPTR